MSKINISKLVLFSSLLLSTSACSKHKHMSSNGAPVTSMRESNMNKTKGSSNEMMMNDGMEMNDGMKMHDGMNMNDEMKMNDGMEMNDGMDYMSRTSFDMSDKLKDKNYLPDRVFFEFDKSDINADSMEILRRHAAAFKQDPKRSFTIRLDGHCDERGTAAYNIALGQRRADSVKHALEKLGVKTKIETRTFGKFKPAVDEHNENAWKQNRRTEIFVLKSQN